MVVLDVPEEMGLAWSEYGIGTDEIVRRIEAAMAHCLGHPVILVEVDDVEVPA